MAGSREYWLVVIAGALVAFGVGKEAIYRGFFTAQIRAVDMELQETASEHSRLRREASQKESSIRRFRRQGVMLQKAMISKAEEAAFQQEIARRGKDATTARLMSDAMKGRLGKLQEDRKAQVAKARIASYSFGVIAGVFTGLILFILLRRRARYDEPGEYEPFRRNDELEPW